MRLVHIGILLGCFTTVAQAQTQPPSAQTVQQGLAVATLLGCTNKQVGNAATQAFYAAMQQAVKEAEGYCKAKQPGLARLTVIRTFREHRASPVVKALHGCYTQNQPAIDALAGSQIAAEISKYIGLLHNPTDIDQEMTLQDICRTPPAAAGVGKQP